MKRSAPGWIAPALAGLGAAACGGDPAVALVPTVAGPAPVAAAPAFPSPARWDYHPSPPQRSIARLRQADGYCIVIAEGGQRWKVATLGTGTAGGRECRGAAVASSALAPEELEGVVRLGATSWMFVGGSGTLYQAADALGPLTRAIAAPEPLGKVVGGAKGIVAVTLDGRLFRWAESDGWRPVSGEGWPALGAARSATATATGGGRLPRVLDLAANEEGMLALAFPETLFVSTDGGQAWTALGAPPIGAQRVGKTLDGRLAAEGIQESIVWTADRTPPFSRVREPLDDRAELVLSVGRGPSAGAVAGGRAVMDADRYYEAMVPGGADEPWVLARGRIEGRLQERPIPGSSDCEAMRLGGAGKHVVIVCERSSESQELRRSDDAGATWSEPLPLSAPDPEFVSIAVAPDGDALVAGVCKPLATGGSCKATAPLLVRFDGGKPDTVVAAASELNGTAAAPAFSANGLSAYFLGRRAKDDRLALFVSQDGGFSFAQRSLEPPSSKPKPVPAAPEPGGDPEEEDQEPAAGDITLTDSSAIRPGDDGTVGIVLRASQGLAYVTTDENGKVQYIAAPPAGETEAVLAGHGSHVLAASAEPHGVFVWESRNGGATWSELPPSMSAIHEVAQGNMPIACSSHGCLLGETVSRLGWGGQSEPPGPDVPDEPSPREIPAVRTPIACELSAPSRWIRIEPADPPNLNAARAATAMRGRSVWSLVSWDKRTGSLNVVSAMLPPSGEGEARVVTRSLLGRAPLGSVTAVDLANQMEGHAVARVRWPEGGKPEGPMRDVEVAWENWMDGTSGRVKLAGAGVFARDSVTAEDEDIRRLQTTLLSVSPGGIFVRPQSPRSSSALALFLRPKGEPDRFDYPRLPDRSWGKPLDVRRYELAMAGGQPTAVGIVAHGAGSPENVYLLAHRPLSAGSSAAPPAGAWQVQPVALAPTPMDRRLLFESNWTYSGSTLGVTSFFSDTTQSRSWAYFQPFRPDGTLGPAEALPTLLDTGHEPRPCMPVQRASTARLQVDAFVYNQPTSVGTRHPVFITEAPGAKGAGLAAPFELITWGAVLHGTPAAPCVAAWEARGMGQLRMTAILSGDLAHSWVFRPAADGVPDASAAGASPEAQKKAEGPKPFALEYRAMSCRFDRLAKIPESVWAEPATSRLER